MSGTTDVTLGSLLAATTIPAGAGVVIRLPSSNDPSKFVLGILTVQALNGGSGGTTPVSAPVNSAAPIITGTAQQGQILTASTGTWSSSPTYAYQWLRAGTAINGATASTYTLASADVGSTISVQVTATNSVGSASATSAATGAVTAASTGGGTTTPPVTTSTRARFAQDTATAGIGSAAAALFASMTQVANPSSDRNGTMTTAADQTKYTWVAVLASAVGSGMRFFDGTGYGGFNGAASSSIYTDDDADPTTIHQSYTDGSGNAWNLYRSSGHSVAATFTLS